MKKGLRTVAALWLTLILSVSLTPIAVKASLHTMGPLHGILHFGAFLVAALLMTLGPFTWPFRLMRGLMAMTFAVTTEYLEAAVYGNQMEWRDVRTDALGIAAGLAAAFLLRGRPRQPGTIEDQTSRDAQRLM